MDELEPLRHEAIRALSAAIASEQLPVSQFESQLALIRQAPNRATLNAIVADLLPSGGFRVPVGLVPPAHDYALAAPVEPADLLRIATVFGSSKRAGSWTVPLALHLRVVMAEQIIDLRDAVFGADVLDIEVQVVFGSLILIVPTGTQVENECHERFSSSTHSTRSAGGAGSIGLLIRITGRTLFGNLEIKERRPSGEDRQPPKWMKLLGMGGDK